MAGRTLKFEIFHEEKEQFENYVERFEFFVTTNEVPDATKKCLFLSSVGPECFQKIKSQVKPQTQSDRTFAQIVAAGEAIYKQQLTVIGQRKSSETVAQYALVLHELCGDCEYPVAIQTEILCNVFVKGLRQNCCNMTIH